MKELDKVKMCGVYLVKTLAPSLLSCRWGRKNMKQPLSWTQCPKCHVDYNFMNCRITLADKSDLCLKCAQLSPQNERPAKQLMLI